MMIMTGYATSKFFLYERLKAQFLTLIKAKTLHHVYHLTNGRKKHPIVTPNRALVVISLKLVHHVLSLSTPH